MGYGFHSYVPKGKGQDSPEQVLQSAPFLLWIPKMVDSQVTMSFNMFQYQNGLIWRIWGIISDSTKIGNITIDSGNPDHKQPI